MPTSFSERIFQSNRGTAATIRLTVQPLNEQSMSFRGSGLAPDYFKTIGTSLFNSFILSCKFEAALTFEHVVRNNQTDFIRLKVLSAFAVVVAVSTESMLAENNFSQYRVVSLSSTQKDRGRTSEFEGKHYTPTETGNLQPSLKLMSGTERNQILDYTLERRMLLLHLHNAFCSCESVCAS